MYRLIIADDEESIRNGIAHRLPWREWGYEVCAFCSDGQGVLEQLKLVHPDVVFSDIRMPGMDGVELMQRLSSAYPDVKIVILSGYSDFKYLNMSIKNHVAEYLLKPTDFEDFEETFLRLKNTLDKERLQTARVSESVQRHFQIWLTSLLEGTAFPQESERFLPMLAAQEIDTDNLVVAAFTLDGHGGDEKTDLLELWRKIWKISHQLPAGQLHLDYQTVDRLCLSLLFHVSLWSLRYGVQMEEVLRTLGGALHRHSPVRHPDQQTGFCAGVSLCLPAGTGPPPQSWPHRQQRCAARPGICGQLIRFPHDLAGKRGGKRP